MAINTFFTVGDMADIMPHAQRKNEFVSMNFALLVQDVMQEAIRF